MRPSTRAQLACPDVVVELQIPSAFQHLIKLVTTYYNCPCLSQQIVVLCSQAWQSYWLYASKKTSLWSIALSIYWISDGN